MKAILLFVRDKFPETIITINNLIEQDAEKQFLY